MSHSKILVWDLPTRVFHWALAASFVGAFVTADSERFRDVHVMLGYTMVGLIAFRLLWGFIGTRYARFESFAFGPRAVLAYLGSLVGRAPQHYIGHNPAGSWAIYLLLALGLLSGLSGYVLYAELTGEWAEEAHETVANAMLAVVVVHVLGVVASSALHRENLIGAMITGWKYGDPDADVRRAHWVVGTVLLSTVAAYWAGAF
ncbi:MAG: cytochrome B [Candidatus Muproteobacteria bacterium RBG_16_65_34]|uniref:Cytochrome B n=1 Tax=Candidatus Muproteobacteria bacterium RBG_16_65_34 TaxID=1817760 RepID=A0A1F6TPH1_9PROT|nr:MAG: cytochrome B [Candidatus Muproteobacteria bacterium RBG_16_65_34]